MATLRLCHGLTVLCYAVAVVWLCHGHASLKCDRAHTNVTGNAPADVNANTSAKAKVHVNAINRTHATE